MNNQQLDQGAKVGTAVFWLLAAVNAATGLLPAPYGMWLSGLACLILAMHVLEVGIFLWKYREKSGNIAQDSLLILVFGVFHLKQFQ